MTWRTLEAEYIYSLISNFRFCCSFLGALVCSQIKYGCSLRTIKNDFVLEYAYYKIGAFLSLFYEVFYIFSKMLGSFFFFSKMNFLCYLILEDHSKKWWPAVVTRLQHDGHVLRHIKVFWFDDSMRTAILAVGHLLIRFVH